ncbi:hypothetical protein [Solitalea lacus]|uniref:hypothetical protein n=1 Tax=Solitalea lacus TaxID=2911172 RepID=UPI001ED9D2AE|nr:hypothetical protein [Solitalea lacus]UKJ07434.1 hypothetical protein L2B55_18175 [Solitalea lacus]
MILHVLNGDALLPNFKRCSFIGDVMIWRECLIEGPLMAQTEVEFWQQRCAYISNTYQVPRAEYQHQVVEKLYKIENPAKYAEINLWFEFDLFCQANMFYILHRLAKSNLSNTTVYWVQPEQNSVKEFFGGFGNINNQQLKDFYAQKVPLKVSDLMFAVQVWEAYSANDDQTLSQLIDKAPSVFRFFKEVFEAHLQRNTDDFTANRIEKRLLEAIQNGVSSEIDLLHRFWENESIYGLGDLQIINYLNNLQQKGWIFELSLTDAGVAALYNSTNSFSF